MSKCNTDTCLFADMCRFTNDNYDPQTCIIGKEMKRRVNVEANKEKASADKTADAAEKPAPAKTPAKKGGAKK